jgi:hypothetical protein
MIELGVSDIWKAAGVVFGLQASAFGWRIKREIAVGEKGLLTWFPVAAYLNVVGMAIILLCVFALPILGVVDQAFVRRAFGLVIILFIGYWIALAGHYEVLRPGSRSYRYFPLQERIVVSIIVMCALIYVGAWVGGYLGR